MYGCSLYWCNQISYDDVVATSAAIVALCALVVSVLNTHYMRLHNEQSVVPLMDLDLRKIQSERDGLIYFGVVLKNNGTGPAIVKEFSFVFDGEKIGSPDAIPRLKLATGQFLDLDASSFPTFFTVLKSGEVIPPGGGEIIFAISFEDKGKSFKFLNRICELSTCEVEVASIYGKRSIVTLEASRMAFESIQEVT